MFLTGRRTFLVFFLCYFIIVISPLSFEEIVLTDPNEMVAKEEQLESSTESHSGDECDGL